jgi:hypothetical protein
MFLGFWDKGDTEISIVDEQKDRYGNILYPARVIKTESNVQPAANNNNNENE